MAKFDDAAVSTLASLLGGAVLLVDELDAILQQNQTMMHTIRDMMQDDSIDLSNHDRLLWIAVRNWKRDYAKATKQDKQGSEKQRGKDSADASKLGDSPSSEATH